MPKPNMQGPRIIFHIEGIIALCVADGRDYFEVGIIKAVDSDKEIPKHIHSITLTKSVHGRPMEPVKIVDLANPSKRVELQLKPALGARPTAGAGQLVKRFRAPLGERSVEALASGESNGFVFSRDQFFSFDWIVDVENELHEGNKVPINGKAIRTILSVSGIDEGIFYTAIHTDDPMFVKRQDVPRDTQMLDGTAEIVEAQVGLGNGATLRWVNDGTGVTNEILLEPGEGVTYEIAIKNDCNASGCQPMDVTPFYNGLYGPADSGMRVEFVASLNPLVVSTTAQTICSVPNFGISDHLPDPTS